MLVQKLLQIQSKSPGSAEGAMAPSVTLPRPESVTCTPNCRGKLSRIFKIGCWVEIATEEQLKLKLKRKLTLKLKRV